MIKLKAPNPHITLGTMQKMKKEELLAAIHSEDIKKAGMELDKHTLIIFLNYELNQDNIPLVYRGVRHNE